MFGNYGSRTINRGRSNDPDLIAGFGSAGGGDTAHSGDHENFPVHKLPGLLIDLLADGPSHQDGK